MRIQIAESPSGVGNSGSQESTESCDLDLESKEAFPAVGARYLVPTGSSASSHWVLPVNQPRTSKTGVTATAGSGVLTLQHASSTSVTVMGVNGPLKTQPLLSRKTRPLSQLPSSIFFFFFLSIWPSATSSSLIQAALSSIRLFECHGFSHYWCG